MYIDKPNQNTERSSLLVCAEAIMKQVGLIYKNLKTIKNKNLHRIVVARSVATRQSRVEYQSALRFDMDPDSGANT